jgi:hypothetical protein
MSLASRVDTVRKGISFLQYGEFLQQKHKVSKNKKKMKKRPLIPNQVPFLFTVKKL